MFTQVRHSRSKRERSKKEKTRSTLKLQRGGDISRIAVPGNGMLAPAPTDAGDAAAWAAGLRLAQLDSLALLFQVGALPIPAAPPAAILAARKNYLIEWNKLIKSPSVPIIPVEFAIRAFLSDPTVIPAAGATILGKVYRPADIATLTGEELWQIVVEKQQELKNHIDAGATIRATLIRMLQQYEAVLNMGEGTHYASVTPSNKFEKLLNMGTGMSYNEKYMNIAGLFINPERATNTLMHSVERIIKTYADLAIALKDINTIRNPGGTVFTGTSINTVNHYDVDKQILINKMTEQCAVDVGSLTNDEIVDGWVQGGPFVRKSVQPNLKTVIDSLLTSPAERAVGRTGTTISAAPMPVTPLQIAAVTAFITANPAIYGASGGVLAVNPDVLREIFRACKPVALHGQFRIAINFDPSIDRTVGAARLPSAAAQPALDTARDQNIALAANEMIISTNNLRRLPALAAIQPADIKLAQQLIAEYFIDHLVIDYFNLIQPPPVGGHVQTQQDQIRLELVAMVFDKYYEKCGLGTNIFKEIIKNVVHIDTHTVEDFWTDFFETMRANCTGTAFTSVALAGTAGPIAPPSAAPVFAGDVGAVHGGITDSFGTIAAKVLIAYHNRATQHPLKALIPNLPNQSFYNFPISNYAGIPEAAFHTVPFLDIPAVGRNPASSLTLTEIYKWFDPVSYMFVIRLMGALGV